MTSAIENISVINQDLITVIMPCYNGEKYLHEAIDSVLGQSYQNVELIVVDDGSTDGSRDIIRSYGQKIKSLEQQNRGPYPARNHGIREASGKYLAFLDADDYWAYDCLSKLHSSLENHNADLAYCGWQNVGEGGPGKHPYIPPDYVKGDLIKCFLKSCPWPIHAALMKREIVEAIGGFSDRYFSSMDYDFWLRTAAKTRNIVLVPEVLAFYRWHDSGQISSGKWKQVVTSINVRKDFIRDYPDLVNHLNKKNRAELTSGFAIKKGYDAFWKRDIVTAHKLFRLAFMSGHWKIRDLKYLTLSLLPEKIFRHVLMLRDDK